MNTIGTLPMSRPQARRVIERLLDEGYNVALEGDDENGYRIELRGNDLSEGELRDLLDLADGLDVRMTLTGLSTMVIFQ